MSILITGASGFIGSALCAELQARQLAYFALYRKPCGKLPKPAPSARYIAELTPQADCRAQLQGVRTVVHLAARVHVMHDTASDPLAAFRVANRDTTLHLARQAAEAGVSRFVFLSSIKVNGEATMAGKPYRFDAVPQPQDAYGISKWEAEQSLLEIAAQTGMEVVIIRPPLVYGPGVKANFLQLLRWVEKGIPLPLAGIDNARSMVYVGNLVDLIIRCCQHSAAAGQTFLVSDGEDVSSAQLVRAMALALNKSPRLFACPLAVLRVVAALAGRSAALERLSSSLQVDMQATCRQLQWQPPFSLAQGLAATAHVCAA